MDVLYANIDRLDFVSMHLTNASEPLIMEDNTSDTTHPVRETHFTDIPPSKYTSMSPSSPPQKRGQHRLRGHSHIQRGKRNIHNSRANKRPTAAKGVDGE